MLNVSERKKRSAGEPSLIYIDPSFLVLDKPSGWVVNSATTTKAPVVQEWLEANNARLGTRGVDRMGIVHRLDKETSGILLVARDQYAMDELQRQFKERSIKKQYTALVHGKLKVQKGEVDAPIGRRPKNRERFGIVKEGREAQTGYEVIGEYIQDETSPQGRRVYTLLRLFPRTGRTHQIRVHMKYLGNPVVSDTFYAGRKTSRQDRKWCPRLFLHASRIEFVHPVHNSHCSFESDLPKDLQEALDTLSMVR